MSTKMTEQEIRANLQRLMPFFHNIELPYNLRTYDLEHARRPQERVRVDHLKSLVWPLVIDHFGSFEGLQVLDVASNAGGFSVEAARSGAAEVLGIDIVDHYLNQARFVKRALELENVQFQKLRIENLDPNDVGTFDLVFCFDILWHFENPMLALRRLASVTRGLIVIETHVTDTPEWEGSPLWFMNLIPPYEEGTVLMATGRWRTEQMCQFTPTAQAVMVTLEYLGFDRVKQVDLKEPAHFLNNERQAIFTAARD